MIFSSIQKLKLSKALSVKGVNFASVIAAKLYNKDFKSLFSYFVLATLFDPKFSIEKKLSGNILLSRNFDPGLRKDYSYMYDDFVSFGTFDELTFERKLAFRSFFMNMFCLVNLIVRNLKLRLGFFDILVVSALQSYYLRAQSNYESIDFSKYTSYVSFCDSYLEENMLAQMAKLKGLKTATLQHGQYRVNLLGKETTDSESYLNFESDYLFAWGEATKQEFIKGGISPERILLCGALKPFYGLDSNVETNVRDAICIVLNGDNHQVSNIEMLQVVNDFCELYKYDFYIRPHPASKNMNYFKYLNRNCCRGLHLDGTSYLLSIVHTSGVFVEMLMSGENFFVYRDEFLEAIFNLEGRSFANVDELYSLHVNNKQNVIPEELKLYFNAVTTRDDLEKRYRFEIENKLM
jgi:hypothetical protein